MRRRRRWRKRNRLLLFPTSPNSYLPSNHSHNQFKNQWLFLSQRRSPARSQPLWSSRAQRWLLSLSLPALLPRAPVSKEDRESQFTSKSTTKTGRSFYQETKTLLMKFNKEFRNLLVKNKLKFSSNSLSNNKLNTIKRNKE